MPQSDRHGQQHWLQQLAFFSIRWELELVLQKEHLESFWPYYLQSLDAIDGKQARRTGTSSPLGELFDHGCDSLSTGSVDKNSFCSSTVYYFFCSFCLPCKLLRVENGRISSMVSLSMPDCIQVLSIRMMSLPCKQFLRECLLQPVLLCSLANLCVWHTPVWLHWRHWGSACCHGSHAHLFSGRFPGHRHLDEQRKYMSKILTPTTGFLPQLYFFTLNQLVTLFGVGCGIYSMFKVTTPSDSCSITQNRISDGRNHWQNFHWGCRKSRQHSGGKSWQMDIMMMCI